MSINIANEHDLNKYISLEVCAQDLSSLFRDFNTSKHTIDEIMKKKQMLSEFMATRYLQDRLRQYWKESDNLPFLRPLSHAEAKTTRQQWIINALKNNENVYIFEPNKMPSEIQTQIRRVGLFLTAMAGEYIDQTISFSRKTGRPPRIYLDYLKGKHDYPDYLHAFQQTLKWEKDELKQNMREAKERRVMDLPNGYYAVQLLNAAAMKVEGRKMANCLSDELQPYLRDVEKEQPSLTIYSIRNSQGIPRVNITLRREEKVISDCSAKANDFVHPEDAPMVATFINALQIPMRTVAARHARLIQSEGQYYDVFHLPPNKKFYDDCLDLEGLDLTELPHLENLVLRGSFMCAHNQLRNLKGAPKVVRGAISFYDNPIEDLTGFPDFAGSAITPVTLDDKARAAVLGETTIIPRQVSSLIQSKVMFAPYLDRDFI